jgi:Uma2 family endonuclease
MIAGLRQHADVFVKDIYQRNRELLDGRVVAQHEASLGENMVRGNVFAAMKSAVEEQGLPHNVYPVGAFVKINDVTVRSPDCVVQAAGFGRARLVEQPVVVADLVLGELSKGDVQARRDDYLSVASIQHYLVIDRDRRIIFHHERHGGNVITHIVRNGTVMFSDLGFEVSFSSIFGQEVKS